MIVALFDRNLNPITQPITQASVDITEKAFDFNDIKVSGYLTESVDEAVIFRLDSDDGIEVYSGLIKKITPTDNKIEVLGHDLRDFFNTEVTLDFVATNAPKTLEEMFNFVFNQFRNNADVMYSQIPFIVNVPEDTTNITDLFGDFSGQVLTTNAYEYLLPYLKYYGYVLRTKVNWGQKRIEFTLDKSRATFTINLPDFVYDLKRSEPAINKTIAIQQYTEFGYQWKKQEYKNVWRSTNVTEWGINPPNNPNYRYALTGNTRPEYEWKIQENVNYDLESYNPYPDSYCRIGYRRRVSPIDGSILCIPEEQWQDVIPLDTTWYYKQPNTGGGRYRWTKTGNVRTQYEYVRQELVLDWEDVDPLETVYAEFEPVEEDPNTRWIQTGEIRAPMGATKYYYLDKNNMIIDGDQYGDYPNRHYPVKTKVFTNEYLANAQFEAILELLNNRYVDNIYIDSHSPLNPIDLIDVKLNDMFDVYQNGFYKQLPVSEIRLKVNEKGEQRRIKLGFKKEMLQDFMKDGVRSSSNGNTLKSQPSTSKGKDDVWTGTDEPTIRYSTWFKPIVEETTIEELSIKENKPEEAPQLMRMTTTKSVGEINEQSNEIVELDSKVSIEKDNEPPEVISSKETAEEAPELEVEFQQPFET